MIKIYEKERKRFEKVYEKMVKLYSHEEVTSMPNIVMDFNYWLDGSSKTGYPQDYFTNIETMVDYQVTKIKKHLDNYNDDFVPFLFPWYGTGVVPSALGCHIKFHDYGDPSVEGIAVKAPEDINKLQMPDFYKDGLLPRVLETIDYMKKNTDLPVSFTDPQGPLNIALCLCGVENLFIWMYTHPKEVHQLMDFCTEVFIEWVKVQKKHIGDNYGIGALPHGIILPEAFGNVWLADDDCTIISNELYKEFVVPYNSRIFEAFNGGTIHFCGSAEHQIGNMLETKGCVGVNNFCMGNFVQVKKMQETYEGKLGLMVCDFTPLDVDDYYQELIGQLSKKGTMIASFISDTYALVGGKYESKERDPYETGKKVEKNFIAMC